MSTWLHELGHLLKELQHFDYWEFTVIINNIKILLLIMNVSAPATSQGLYGMS